MTINGLSKFLKKNCINAYNEIHISNFAFKKIAIDISLYIFKYRLTCQHRWLASFVNLVCVFRKHQIHPVFIYDGGSPIEKNAEKEERKLNREKNEDNINILVSSLQHYYNTNEIDQILIDHHNKISKANKFNQPQRLLLTKPPINSSKNIDMNLVIKDIEHKQSYLVNITDEDFKRTKELFDILNIPYFTAPFEAETLCCDLYKRGLVDAILSDDSDVIAYGCSPLKELNVSTGICTQVDYDTILEELQLTKEEFLDLCVMCGTDYNKNIFKVGPEKSYKLIKEHKNIENIHENTKLDISILNHKRTRELFTVYSKFDVKIPYCKKPDFNKLEEFMIINNIKLSIENIKSSFVNDNLVLL
jgi:flap endonuclease-1